MYRQRALDKYDNVCAKCGYSEYKEVLEVHHIDGNREHNDLYNLVILCPTCHKVEDWKRRGLIKGD